MTELEFYEYTASRVEYDREKGRLFWKPKAPSEPGHRRWNTIHTGKPFGAICGDGYVTAAPTIAGKRRVMLAHRLIWFIENKTIPCGQIDHINQDKADNRITNLRDVTPGVNMRNCRLPKNNKSGHSGVYWCKLANRWKVKIGLQGVKHRLGSFTEFDKAVEVAKAFYSAHEFSPLHGRSQRVEGANA